MNYPFTFSIAVSPGVSIDFDCEADIDPGEPGDFYCPPSDAEVCGVSVKYLGVDCTDTLDEHILERITRAADEIVQKPHGPDDD